MSESGTFEYAAEAIKEGLGLDIGRFLGEDRIQFRDVETGRFTFAADFWDYFRENYEELKASGAI